MSRTTQVVKHVRSNARTVLNGSIVKAPDSGGLYYGEIGLNSNVIDPTLYIPLVTNTGVTEVASTALITTLALFKSLGWLQTNLMGTTDPTEIRTLKYITDTLDILTADSDSVIDSWNEVKAFLLSIPSDDNYTLMSMIGSKASINFTTGLPTTKTLNIVSIEGNGSVATLTFATLTEEPFEVGSQIVINNSSVAGYNNYTGVNSAPSPIWTVISCTKTDVMFVCDEGNMAGALGTVKGAQLAMGIKLYDDITLKTTLTAGGADPDYSILRVDLTSGLTAGRWDDGTWTPGTLGTITQGTNKAIAASLVQGFYNEFSKMFTLYTGHDRIQANLDFYSIGEITAYGTSDGLGGGGGGLIEVLNIYSALSTSLSAFVDDTDSGETFNAYTINRIHNRVLALEAGNAGGIVLTALTTGFSIAGGSTSKTLSVLNTLTLQGTDSSTLNIGGGGTLGTAAFLASTAFAPSTGVNTITTVGNISVGTWNAGVISPVYGGTGVANNVNYTISLGGGLETQGDLDLLGHYSTTFNITATTNITLPVDGIVLSTTSIIDCGTY